jgi:putative hemolysin
MLICSILSNIKEESIKNEILSLRNIIFQETYSYDIKDNWDNYDDNSYHFLIYNNDKKLVGYYRLRKFNNNFNDTLASELFDLNNFSLNEFAEISRACVHPNYRDGSVISLLWTNISGFLLTHEIQYCIGCTSIINNTIILNNTFSYILNKNLIFKDLILPKNKIIIEKKLDEEHIKKKNVTTLIRAYGKQGALFSPWPSLDEKWNTIDFFTVFSVASLTKKLAKMG